MATKTIGKILTMATEGKDLYEIALALHKPIPLICQIIAKAAPCALCGSLVEDGAAVGDECVCDECV